MSRTAKVKAVRRNPGGFFASPLHVEAVNNPFSPVVTRLAFMRKKPCAPPDKFGNSAEHPLPARHRHEIRPKFPGRFLSGNTTGADNVIFFTNFSCGRRAQLL